MKATRILVAITALGGSACSLLTSLDGYSEGVPDAAAASTDASVDVAVGPPPATGDAAPLDAADEAGLPNLHPNGTFEATTMPWYGFQAQPITLDSTAHSGSKSLRVCTAQTTTDYFTADDQGAITNPVANATYHATAWVRVPQGGVPLPEVKLFMRTVNTSPSYVTLEFAETALAAVDESWKQFEVALVVTKPAQRLNVVVGATHVAGACMLIDDVRVERVQ